MLDYFDSIYLRRRMSSQGHCEDTTTWDENQCLDAIDDVPAGSTIRIDREYTEGEPFATTRKVMRGGWVF